MSTDARVLEAAAEAAIEAALARGRRRKTLPDPDLRRLIRVRAGLSQEELAQLIGTSRAAVSRWETGARVPRNPHLDRYAAVLDRLAREVLR